MTVVLNQNWAGYTKGETLDITDADVLAKGIEIGLFSDPKAKKEVKTDK